MLPDLAFITDSRNSDRRTINPVTDMRREFADRADLITYLTQEFPEAAAIDSSISDTQGGRAAAEVRLKQLDPVRYGKTRNALNGALTRLSPYLRHGVLSLAETRDTALDRVTTSRDAEKLINQFAWRDYWQRLYIDRGDKIWKDQEPYKTGHSDYAEALPDDIRDGKTQLACIDGFSQELRSTGHLHNHARMWFAAYIVHWRRVRWQSGARWFLSHLLDGDPASNNLSWQWVASTFSQKPYYFNRENLDRYTNSRYCKSCPSRDNCPFDASYEILAECLFPAAEFWREADRNSGGWHKDNSKPKPKKR
jgi:deoxyribodipyrimidine photo-lyase